MLWLVLRQAASGPRSRPYLGSRGGLVVPLAALLVLAGCGAAEKRTAHLQGTITIAGKSLPADALANISFRPTAQGQSRAAGVTVVAGKYDCPDVPLGKVAVTISIQHPTGKMVSEAGGTPFQEYASLISGGSGINLEVTGDKPNQDFDLESI
jgi:hypothetical protein